MKAASGASAGAGLGAAIGSAVPFLGTGLGALIGGGLGAIFGGSRKSDPEVQMPQLSDVSLERDNPELYKQLQRIDAQINAANEILSQRRAGLTPGEKYQRQAAMGELQNRLSAQGMLGSGMSYGMLQDAERNLREEYADRVLRESLARQNAIQQAEAMRANVLQSGIQDAYRAKVAQAQGQQANLDASNNFYSNLLMGGLQAGVSGLLADSYGPRAQASGSSDSWYGGLSAPSFLSGDASLRYPSAPSPYSLGADLSLGPAYPMYASREY
jgi:hypothetical protein